jgi:acyl-CoA thioester hydrolase
MSSIKEPQSLVTISIQDCDPLGHLNNSRYADYFLNARHKHLWDNYKLRVFEPGKSTRSWVMSKYQISYLRSAVVFDEVLIKTRLIAFADKFLAWEGHMMDSTGKETKALCWMEFVYIDLETGRPVSHGEELLKLFGEAIVDAVYKPGGFDERTLMFKNQNKALAQTGSA